MSVQSRRSGTTPPASPGNPIAGGGPVAEPREHRREVRAPHTLGHHGRSDVAGLGHDVAERHVLDRVRVGVVDRVAADLHPPRDLEDLAQADGPRLQRRRGRHDLVHRPGLEHVRDGAVPDRLALRDLEGVRVEPGIASHRVDVAGARVHHDDRAALRAVLLHRALAAPPARGTGPRDPRSSRAFVPASPAPRPRSRSRSAGRPPTAPPCACPAVPASSSWYSNSSPARPVASTPTKPEHLRRERAGRVVALGHIEEADTREGRALRDDRRPRRRSGDRGRRTWRRVSGAAARPSADAGPGRGRSSPPPRSDPSRSEGRRRRHVPRA